MLKELKQKVLKANLDLVKNKLVLFTWGNVSEIDRKTGLVVIKPSGVDYDGMTADDMVVVDLDGKVVEGNLRPSSDTPTHLEFYKAFPNVGGVTHTHSTFATAWAQAGRSIPFYGTTHADYFYGSIPCARHLTQGELEEDYERNTGKIIVETFQERCIEPTAVPGVVCASHGPFTWGKDAAQAVYHGVVLEEVAKMAILTRQVRPSAGAAPQRYQDKHYFRKHGPGAYYGQG